MRIVDGLALRLVVAVDDDDLVGAERARLLHLVPDHLPVHQGHVARLVPVELEVDLGGENESVRVLPVVLGDFYRAVAVGCRAIVLSDNHLRDHLSILAPEEGNTFNSIFSFGERQRGCKILGTCLT